MIIDVIVVVVIHRSFILIAIDIVFVTVHTVICTTYLSVIATVIVVVLLLLPFAVALSALVLVLVPIPVLVLAIAMILLLL